MSNGKQPGVAFWATVMVLLPVLYVASIGPACWISSRANVGVGAVTAIYRPLQSSRRLNKSLNESFVDWYSEIGAAKDWCWLERVTCVPPPDGPFSESHWIWQHGQMNPRTIIRRR